MQHYSFFHLLFLSLLISLCPSLANAEYQLNSHKSGQRPIIDGEIDNNWNKIKAIEVTDKLTKKKIKIKSLYDKETISFLVIVPDETKNDEHKNLIWNKEKEIYVTGNKREDSFVFKWSIDGQKKDLSLSANEPYIADIWYWKAYRTDMLGFADDKRHIYSFDKSNKSKKFVSKNGNVYYLERPADEGGASYKAAIYTDFIKEELPKYLHLPPTKSRADIKAKGKWENGHWCIEFQRKLDTEHSDDVKFITSRSYYFGVASTEIAGKKPNPKNTNPIHGAGIISDLIKLVFIK